MNTPARKRKVPAKVDGPDSPPHAARVRRGFNYAETAAGPRELPKFSWLVERLKSVRMC